MGELLNLLNKFSKSGSIYEESVSSPVYCEFPLIYREVGIIEKS